MICALPVYSLGCDDRHCDDCADDVSTCVASTGCATGYGNTDAVVLCIGSKLPRVDIIIFDQFRYLQNELNY